MKFRNTAGLFCLAFAAFFTPYTTHAQGVIVPIICDIRPCRPPRPIPRPVPLPNVLPVKSIRLDTKIKGQVATTFVEQVFRNDTPHTLEGTYFFPIPDDASIEEFAIWENGKKLGGEVRTREEARRIYDEIVRRQRDPGLLEYAGKNLFQASIFPIPPNSDKKLELRYSQVLKAESGTVAYRYPLGTGRNLWSRHPHQENLPQKGPQKFGTVSGRVEISAKDRIRNIYSPSHTIDVKNKGEETATLTFETSGNDNDFQLFYGLSDSDFGLSLLTYREPGKDGYFLLMLSPRDDVSERQLVNKDIVFVLDTSGSMMDVGKLDKAKSAVLFGIRTLQKGDRFNVVRFSGNERLMESGLVASDDAGKKRGEEYVNQIRALGGTNINDALVASLKQFEKNDRPKILVFMTDGRPTVGEVNIDKIIENVRENRSSDVRIFPFGFGYDVNTALLDRLGAENLGISDYIQPAEDLEVKVSNFFTRISSPVLSDIDIDYNNIETELLYPAKVTDLFRGMQLVVIGRYRNSNDLRDAVINLSGKSGGETRGFSFGNLEFPLRAEENEFLPRLWAVRRVGWLVEQIRLNGESKELRDEVADLGTRYGIVTPYTSFLATDGSVPGTPARIDQLRAISGAMREQSGAGAVQMSVQQNAQKSNISVAADRKDSQQILVNNTATNRYVANKNFFNRNNVWIDSEYAASAKLPEVNLKFASDRYFELAANEPGLAQYLSLGEEVVVVWKNRVYRISK